MNAHPKTLRAILVSFLGCILFYLVNAIIVLILSGIIYLLAQIPLIRILANWLARFIGADSFLVPLIGYFITLLTVCELSKDTATADLSCILLGSYLLVISVICLILNLLYGNPIWINILYGAAGVAFIVRKSAGSD